MSTSVCTLDFDSATIWILLIVHTPLPPLMFLMARVVRARVDLQHPVFSLIFVELIFLSVLVTLALALVVTLVLLNYSWGVFMTIFSSAANLAIVYHQATWLCITYLRCTVQNIG